MILRGIMLGAGFGAVTGSIGALGVVHPESHGFWQVFLSGLRGNTWAALVRRHMFNLLCRCLGVRSARRLMMLRAPLASQLNRAHRVDVFAVAA